MGGSLLSKRAVSFHAVIQMMAASSKRILSTLSPRKGHISAIKAFSIGIKIWSLRMYEVLD